ncbi:hypothetical protein GCM10023225_00500 [Kineococcus glutinatus]|uniref:Uncharacterized protein n=1 Tax=Kineococcus glutinatus TaxID=1070872 RepID=A0ABP9H3R9_9ACTN
MRLTAIALARIQAVLPVSTGISGVGGSVAGRAVAAGADRIVRRGCTVAERNHCRETASLISRHGGGFLALDVPVTAGCPGRPTGASRGLDGRETRLKHGLCLLL